MQKSSNCETQNLKSFPDCWAGPRTISWTPKGKINDNQRATKITVWMTFLLSGYPWGRSPQGFPIPLYTKVFFFFFFVCKPLYTRFLCTFVNKHGVSSLELALSSRYLTQPLSGQPMLTCVPTLKGWRCFAVCGSVAPRLSDSLRLCRCGIVIY